jgi:hypothetical protein
MATAMVLHGVWDDLGGIVGNNSVLLVFAWIVVISVAEIIAVRVYQVTVGPERANMRAVLGPEVANGTLTAQKRTASGQRLPERASVRARALTLGQNVAIGLTGLPDVPAKRTGATAR